MPIGSRPSALKLRIDEAHIEFGVVDDDLRVADKREKLLDEHGEDGLVLQQLRGVAVNPHGVLGDIALRVDQVMEDASGRRLVHDLDRADLEQPVSFQRAQAGGFGVKHDLTHDGSFVLPVQRRRGGIGRPAPASPTRIRRCR